MTSSKVYTLLFPEYVRPPDNQIFYVPTGISNVVGDASGAVGNIFALLEDNDLHVRPVSFGAAGCAHSRSVSSDDDEFHNLTSFKALPGNLSHEPKGFALHKQRPYSILIFTL